MIKGLLGKKIGMSRLFVDKGTQIPVTIIQIEPATVIQKKTTEVDGYEALQLGSGALNENKQKRQAKALIGHYKALPPMRKLREFKVEDGNFENYDVGSVFDVTQFKTGDYVDIAGTSKGRGFAGVVKRHGFAGGPASHGHRFGRTTGSIGNRKFPGRVFKNKKMPGHMGAERVKVQNLAVVEVNPATNSIAVKGAVPGANGSYLEILHAIKK